MVRIVGARIRDVVQDVVGCRGRKQKMAAGGGREARWQQCLPPHGSCRNVWQLQRKGRREGGCEKGSSRGAVTQQGAGVGSQPQPLTLYKALRTEGALRVNVLQRRVERSQQEQRTPARRPPRTMALPSAPPWSCGSWPAGGWRRGAGVGGSGAHRVRVWRRLTGHAERMAQLCLARAKLAKELCKAARLHAACDDQQRQCRKDGGTAGGAARTTEQLVQLL